jgi:hypothetical protein
LEGALLLTEPFAETVPGLEALFYVLDPAPQDLSEVDFSATPAHRETVYSLDYSLSHDPFWDGGPRNLFAAEFIGQIKIQTGGQYHFRLRADELAQVWIDGELVVDYEVSQRARTSIGVIDLESGIHDIRVLYLDRRGAHFLDFDWSGADTGGDYVSVDGTVVSHLPPNTAPVAADDAIYVLPAGDFFRVDPAVLLANDTDPDGDALEIVGLESAEMDGSEIVVEDADGDGIASFLYTVSDGEGFDTAEVTVSALNDGLVAVDDAVYALPVGDMLHVDPVDLLANDVGAAGGKLEIVSLDGAMVHGDHIMVQDADGDGIATFSYTVSDAESTDTAEVVVVVPDQEINVDAWVEMVKSAPEAHIHGGDELRAGEHANLLELVPRAAATHVAVSNGAWSDPSTWHNGEIPWDGADVLIPEGVEVTVDGIFNARLDTIRVDGKLDVLRDEDTRLVVETLVVSSSGLLEYGTEADPVAPYVTAEIVIHSTTPGELPEMSLGRGVITHGSVSIAGGEKLAHTTIAGEAQAGDNFLTLSEAPIGWRVGDKIVLSGTDYNPDGSDSDNTRFQDEVLEIIAINGNEVYFVNLDTGGTTLRFDHLIPDGYEDRFEIPLANLSRSVVIRSEGGKDTDVPDRGHVMFMHSNDVDVQYAAFVGLGRTDKNVLIDDPGLNVDGSLGADGTEEGTNPRGRYGVHLHRLGVEDGQEPAEITGIVVDGSPGWGLVHHDSHAILTGNVVFDVVGTGIAAEAGNETGRWENNLTIKTTGDDRSSIDFDGSARVPLFDFGFNGEGYWIQGAPLVEFVDNAAASANGAAIEIFTDVDGNRNKDVHGSRVSVSTLAPEQQAAFLAAGYKLSDTIDIRAAISPGVTGFVAINSLKGIEIWNHMRNDDGLLSPFGGDGHALRTVISDFELWGIWGEGIFTQYSTQIDFINGVIVGDPDDPLAFRPNINGQGLGRGIGSNDAVNDLGYYNIEINGFEIGLRLPHEAGFLVGDQGHYFDFNMTEIQNLTVSNVESVFGNLEAFWMDEERFPNYLSLDGLTLGDGVPRGIAPVAAFTAEGLGGPGAVRLDATSSFDTDPNPMIRVSDNAIAAYGWDFDSDSTIDDWGRWVTHSFGAPGTYEVDLTVWDSDGQSNTVTQSVVVESRPYENLVLDCGFDYGLKSGTFYRIDAGILNKGWRTSGWVMDNGAVAAPLDTPINNGVFQVILDNGVRQGTQSFSYDLDYSYYNDNEGAYLQVAIWGFDTEFGHKAGYDYLNSEGAIPMEGTLLYHDRVGATDGWETMTAELDFMGGFKFITMSFQFEGRWGDADAVRPDDAILIDNVEISDEAWF